MIITDVRSPGYVEDFSEWSRWRLAVKSGPNYINSRLARLPSETLQDYSQRIRMTPAPATIKTTIREVIAGVFSQMNMTTRSGGPPSLQAAFKGQTTGVDGAGTSIDEFMVLRVLRELLIMRRVGIYLDRKPLIQGTLQEAKSRPPYAYIFPAEQILAWHLDTGAIVPDELLLQRLVPETWESSQLITGHTQQYSHYLRTSDGVVVTEYGEQGDKLNQFTLDLHEIPFILLELDESLISEAVTCQDALLNLGSSNLTFAIASNLAVYVEQTDMTWLMSQLKTVQDGEKGIETASNEIILGLTRGRRYDQKSEAPDFISPDNSNLIRAFDLHRQLRDDIRQMILLAVHNVSIRGNVTATALAHSTAAASNGLAAIATTLARAERVLARFWADYENEPDDFTVKYPPDFQILSQEARLALIDKYVTLRDAVPSRHYQEAVSDMIVSLVLGAQVSATLASSIKQEIRNAPAMISDPKVITALIKDGPLPREYAARLLGLPADAGEKANAEHADRLRRIAEAQSDAAARGTPDLAADNNAADEKVKGDT